MKTHLILCRFSVFSLDDEGRVPRGAVRGWRDPRGAPELAVQFVGDLPGGSECHQAYGKFGGLGNAIGSISCTRSIDPACVQGAAPCPPLVIGLGPVSREPYLRTTCSPPPVRGVGASVVKLLYENGLAWGADDVIGSFLSFNLAFYATVSAIDLKFPVGTRYKFNLVVDLVEDYSDDRFTQEV